MPLAPVVAAVALSLAAPADRKDSGRFIAGPYHTDPTIFLGTRESLQTAASAAPPPAGPVLVPLLGRATHGDLAEAREHLKRAAWPEAAAALRRHAEVTDARSAVIARYDARLIEVGLGTATPWLLLNELLDAPKSAASQAAELFWTARELLTDDDERHSHARMLLHGFGRAVGPELSILAEIELARVAWQQSCPIADNAGTCGVMIRVDWPFGCHDVQRDVLFVVDRDPDLADGAQRRLRSALRRARSLPATPRLTEALTQARWLHADASFEALLRVQQPIGLSFTVEEWREELPGRRNAALLATQRADHGASWRRFDAFYTRKQGLFHRLDREYTALIAEADPHTVFAALYRGAQAARDLALHLALHRDRPVTGYSFCHDRGPAAQIRDAASRWLASCATLAVETGLVDEWAARCQDDAAALEPDLFPAQDELTPDRARPQPVAFDLVTALDRD